MSEELDRLVKARIGLVLGSCFFGELAHRLELRIDDKSEAPFWTDGVVLAARSEAVRDLEMDELEAIMARAVMHGALGHPARREGRDRQLWADACMQAACHELLESKRFRLPPFSMPSPQFKGLSAEQIYAQMANAPEGEQGSEEEQEQEGQEEGQEGSQSPGEGQEEGQEGSEEGPQSPGEGQEGSQSPGGGTSGGMEMRDAPGDEAEREEKAQEWEQATAQAAQNARAAGDLPGSMERLVGEIVSPKIGWKEALQRFFKSRAREDFSWLRPNRRFLSSGIILPGRSSIRMGKVALFVDISGSIRQSDVDAFFSEIESLRDECNPEGLFLLPFDTRVTEMKEFSEDEPVKMKLSGGGGTDFAPPILKLEEEGIEPEVAIYLTDLECSSYAPEPSYPVLWCATPSARLEQNKPPYGEVLSMV